MLEGGARGQSSLAPCAVSAAHRRQQLLPLLTGLEESLLSRARRGRERGARLAVAMWACRRLLAPLCLRSNHRDSLSPPSGAALLCCQRSGTSAVAFSPRVLGAGSAYLVATRSTRSPRR